MKRGGGNTAFFNQKPTELGGGPEITILAPKYAKPTSFPTDQKS